MRKKTIAYGLLLAGIAGLAGCANSDYTQSRKTREGVTINGSQFAPAEENDQNAFGRENEGLSSNPETKPSASELWDKGKICSDVSTFSGEPEEVSVFVNEVVDVKFTLEGFPKGRGDCPTEEEAKEKEQQPLAGQRVVIVLERPDGADGSIDIVDVTKNLTQSKSETKIVTTTDQNGEVAVRLYTGSSYSNKNPMYYINAWHADDLMAPIKVKVKKLPQLSDGGFLEGNKTTPNDLTPPADYSKIETSLDEAEIVNIDPLKQELFVSGTKRLHVKILGSSSSDSASQAGKPAAGEGICWKFVTKRVTSDGSLEVDSARAIAAMSGDVADVGACSKTDEKGEFWVEIDTGAYYDERYYLNFFHPKATPLSYQIDTFIAPETLGEQGNDAEISVDVTDGVNDISGSFSNGEFSPKDSKALIDNIFGTDACSEPVRSIYEQCYNGQCEFNCNDGQGDATDCGDDFDCELKQNPDGTWSIFGKDGDGNYTKPVKGDIDGDCTCNDDNYKPDLKCALPDDIECKTEGGTCSKSGKPCLENISIVLEMGKDESGNVIIENKGVDTDGDGKVDVAPDVCASKPRPAVCDTAKYRFVWSDKSNKGFGNQKLTTPIGKEFEFYINSRDKNNKGQKDGEFNESDVNGVKASILRGTYPSNDAMLRVGTKDVESTAFSISGGDPSSLTLWSGKAFGAMYYIQLAHDDVLPANIPIATTNAANMPGGEGDSPDDTVLNEGGEAVTPPGGIGVADPNLGHCKFFIDPDDVEKLKNADGNALQGMMADADGANSAYTSTSIETPTARTLVLNVGLVCDYGKTGSGDRPSIAKNVKTHWKLTRGKSTFNNGTLLSSVNATDLTGIASSQFYAGTGYGATYYVSVFHPNASQDPACTKDCKLRPAVFEIKVNNSKGVVPGAGDKDDPILPGDKTGTDKDGNRGICCNTDSVGNSGICTECTEGNVSCKDSLNRTYVYCDENKGTESHGEKPETNKSLPSVACDVTKLGCIDPEEDGCTDVDGNAIGEDGEGCLLLSIENEEPLKSYVDTYYGVKVKLQLRTSEGIESVADTVYVTANKGPGADGGFATSKQRTNSKSGMTVFQFHTGSYTTSYKISASHPNYADKDGNMIPVSKTLAIVDKSLIETKKSDESVLKLTTDSKDNEGVVYYVMSSDYYSCDAGFAISKKSEASAKCNQAQVPPEWKGIKIDGKDPKQSMCAVEATSGEGKEIKVPSNRSSYLVYAVKYSRQRPVDYGCVESQYLPPPSCSFVPRVDENGDAVMNNGEQVMDEKCKTSLSLEIPLQDVPLKLGNSYQMRTLVDLGPLVAIPDAQSCPETDRSVPCLIYKITKLYQKFIGEDPAKKILDNLELFLFNPKTCMSDSGAGKLDADCRDGDSVCSDTMAVSVSELCDSDYKNCKLCDLDSVPADMKPKNPCATFSASKASQTCTGLSESDKETYSNSRVSYKSSKCICAQIYHYTADPSECSSCSKIGGKIKPLFMSLAEKMLRKAFAKANIEDNLCKIVDSLQFVELQGNVTFDTKNGDAAIAAGVSFEGAQIPYTDKKVRLGRVVSAKVPSASRPAETNSIIIPNMGLNFSYGLLIVDILAELLPSNAITEDKNGNKMIDFKNLVDCSSLLKGGLKIPLVGIEISAETINGLCSVVMQKLTEETYNLAEQQYINLNMTLSGSGEMGSTDTTCEISDDGCEADVITGGIWSGTASMSGVEENISGLWVANKLDVAEPSFSDGEKSVEQFMAEHSVCRIMLRGAQDKLDVVSNQVCLGGSFDNPAARLSNNKCSNEDCNVVGIVVCKEKKLNPVYANASAAEIIKAANEACKAEGNRDKVSCKGNLEIINNGEGITNEECRGNFVEACEGNPSIIVAPKGDEPAHGAEYVPDSLTGCAAVEVGCSPEGEDKKDLPQGYSYLRVDADSMKLYYTKEEEEGKCYECNLTQNINEACAGQCDSPGCIMNTEVTECKNSENDKDPVPKPAVPIASWTFENVTTTKDLQDSLRSGMKARDKDGKDVELTLTYYGCEEENAKAKLVLGSDGALGAVGTDAIVATCDSSEAPAGYFVISGQVAGKKITRITFNVMGSGREISYGKGDDPNALTGGFISSETLWENKSLEFDAGADSINMIIAPTGNGVVGMKAMRIDDIIVYGVGE